MCQRKEVSKAKVTMDDNRADFEEYLHAIALWTLAECQFSKTETGCKEVGGDKNVAIVKIGPQLGCVSQDSEALVSQSVSLGIDSKRKVHSVYATSSKYPGKERTIAWTNTSSNLSISESLRCEI